MLRIRSTDLAAHGLSTIRALLIVENESCLHLLPKDLPGVVAVLGTGNNLTWLHPALHGDIRIAYWGDLDTWGLTLLPRARSQAPKLTPLLMTLETFDLHSSCAVPEKAPLPLPRPKISPPAKQNSTSTF